MTKFKDKCDNCGQFDYLKGMNGKCLCLKCQKICLKDNNEEENIKDIHFNSKIHQKQLNIFDLEPKVSQNSHSIDDIMYM